MKLFKRAVSFALVAALALSMLTACGGGGGGNNSSSGSSSQSTGSSQSTDGSSDTTDSSSQTTDGSGEDATPTGSIPYSQSRFSKIIQALANKSYTYTEYYKDEDVSTTKITVRSGSNLYRKVSYSDGKEISGLIKGSDAYALSLAMPDYDIEIQESDGIAISYALLYEVFYRKTFDASEYVSELDASFDLDQANDIDSIIADKEILYGKEYYTEEVTLTTDGVTETATYYFSGNDVEYVKLPIDESDYEYTLVSDGIIVKWGISPDVDSSKLNVDFDSLRVIDTKEELEELFEELGITE